MTTTPERRPLRILDLVAGIALAIVGGLIGLVMLSLLTQLNVPPAACEGVTADGLRCDNGYLNGMVILGTAIVVFGWGLTTGFFVVRAIRRRIGFWLPIVGILIIFAAFYVVAFLLQPYWPTSG